MELTFEHTQGKAERADFPLIRQKCPGRDAEDRSQPPHLAWLLRHFEHEDNNTRLGWVAAKKIPLLHLEAVEAPQDESEEPCKTVNAPVAGLQKRKRSEGILGNCRKRLSYKDHYK